MDCTHAMIATTTRGESTVWYCLGCRRGFFPSGETGAEQEAVRLRDQVHKLNNELTALTLERDALKVEGERLTRKLNALAFLRYGPWSDEYVTLLAETPPPKCRLTATCLEWPLCPCGRP
jgi:hypothetical protein